jgi:hypothetical protein
MPVGETHLIAVDFLVGAERRCPPLRPGPLPHQPQLFAVTTLTIERKAFAMGFTGSLVLARTPVPLTDLQPLTGYDVEIVGSRDDQWQLVAFDAHAHDTPEWAAALVEATASPMLIAVIDDSDTALLLADSPAGHRWITVLNAPADSAGRAAVADIRAMTAIADTAVAWSAEAGYTADTEAVLDALCAADRDNRAADKAFGDALDQRDFAAAEVVVRNQISFIEVYVLRVLAALGLTVPVGDADSRWTHLATQAHTRPSVGTRHGGPGSR